MEQKEEQEIVNKILEFILEHIETKKDLCFLESVMNYYEKKGYDTDSLKRKYTIKIEEACMLFDDYNALKRLNHIKPF